MRPPVAPLPAWGVALALAVVGSPAVAQRKGDVTVADPQVRASLGRAPNTAAYLSIRNAGSRPDRLVGAACSCAGRVEIHTHRMQGGVARMERIPSLVIPARGSAVLAPGGAHLMLFALKQPIREGAEPRLTLVFERAGAVPVTFRARARIAAPSAGGHAH